MLRDQDVREQRFIESYLEFKISSISLTPTVGIIGELLECRQHLKSVFEGFVFSSGSDLAFTKHATFSHRRLRKPHLCDRVNRCFILRAACSTCCCNSFIRVFALFPHLLSDIRLLTQK